MKINILIIAMFFAVSCGTEETQNTNQINLEENELILSELKEEQSKYVPTHFFGEDLSMHSFPKSVYDNVDELMGYVIQFQNIGFENPIPDELNQQYHQSMEQFIITNEDVDPDSHGVLEEFANPIREVFTEIEASSSKENFENNLREAKIYLLNFRKLFPE